MNVGMQLSARIYLVAVGGRPRHPSADGSPGWICASSPI